MAIDGLKEVQEAVMLIEAGLSTYEKECAKRGDDYQEIFAQQVRETMERRAAGLKPPAWRLRHLNPGCDNQQRRRRVTAELRNLPHIASMAFNEPLMLEPAYARVFFLCACRPAWDQPPDGCGVRRQPDCPGGTRDAGIIR